MNSFLIILTCFHICISSKFIGAGIRTYTSASEVIFVSEKGDDYLQDCGTERDPCKTIGKGIEQMKKGREAKTLKIVDSAEIPYGFLFNKDFSLTLTTVSKQRIQRNISFKLKELAEKGKFHMINEKTLKLEHLKFDLNLYKAKQFSSKGVEEESAIILSKGAQGDLTIRDCDMRINERTDDYTTFSFLRITDGKILIDELEFLSDYYYQNKAN
ncbi:uncharacterized protein MONOS_7414 [Monocercomonoides exilis]|uniref:uncharacterized protein n=1 Tax=Monocercomonoides exilis TaxID=2049356 RepID=UPI003559619D|nr:hypothetical protein MONOS_7414 [Monocercomonoides exilis]|eukprot:MONOS_7414.1-p1 / transcript=MONOS_7414.1 / gene=MONOS_7414 / organism=Monocercomonoides_exilis_PA203 / gene_product=unspecified product / transcript_product=unspecified product / location=Mono_scaffold00252:56489-57130(-) / protein_length=214 / sequence_SO=supercontig / SO=protein_coding / is_pseudo=false